MTQILMLRKSDILSLDDYLGMEGDDLEKALFKHAYYSQLVPKKITGKDGVERIHWVNPDKGKKNTKKMHLVAHFHEGAQKEHHAKIKEDHEIDLNHLHRFSHGDKVKITGGPYKGQTGVFVGSHGVKSNPAARVSVKFEDKDGLWKTSNPIGAGNLELVHRATDSTLEAVAPKSQEYVNRKGQKTVASKAWLKKRVPAKRQTSKERHEELGKGLGKGVMFQRGSDGTQIFIVGEKGDKLHVKILNAPKGQKKTEGYIEKARFEKMVNSGSYHRVIASKLGSDTKKKTTRMLETGELHANGKAGFDDKGNATMDPQVVKDIIFENWDLVETTVQSEASKYPSVDPAEISGVDMWSQMSNAITTFEPYLNKPLAGRLRDYVQDTARKKAQQIHQINVLRDRNDIDGNGSDRSATGIITHEEQLGEITGGAFVNPLDSMIFHEILNDEADMMEWYAGNGDYADVLMRITGIGTGEASITQAEGAKELYGKVFDSSGKPISIPVIKKRLSRSVIEMMKTFSDEAKQDPDFAATLRQAVMYRNKMSQERDNMEADAKDLSTIRAVQGKYDGGRNAKADIAKKLIKNGSSVNDAFNLVSTVENIVDGKLMPHDYRAKIASEDYAKIITQTLKDMMPAGTGNKIPERFHVSDWYKYDPKANIEKPSIKWLSGAKKPVKRTPVKRTPIKRIPVKK